MIGFNGMMKEQNRWNLLCKRRREINRRIYDSELCFLFFIELSTDKQFHIISEPQVIHKKRVEEQEGSLARAISKDKNLDYYNNISKQNRKVYIDEVINCNTIII